MHESSSERYAGLGTQRLGHPRSARPARPSCLRQFAPRPHRALAGAASHRLAALILSVAFMRRSSLEATVADLETVLGILRALRSGHRANANRLPIHNAILLAVAKRPEGTTMRELRSELTLSHSSVTRACLAMEGEGLVRISRAHTDRRAAENKSARIRADFITIT